MRYNYTGNMPGNCTGSCRASHSLAIASVPMQKWQNIYTPEKALAAGTMFGELDLPFRGGKCR